VKNTPLAKPFTSLLDSNLTDIYRRSLMAYDRPYETKAGTGTLFPNDRKTQDNHPDFKGKIKWHNGTEAWLSAWEKEAKTGRKFLSIQVGITSLHRPLSMSRPRLMATSPRTIWMTDR
jgi:uncharacterized protein (DUF736 family)